MSGIALLAALITGPAEAATTPDYVRCDAFAAGAGRSSTPSFCLHRDGDDVVVTRSDDRGRTWRWTADVPAPGEGFVNAAFVVPHDDSVVVAFTTDDAIHASTDGGSTFRVIGSNSNFRPESVTPFRSLTNAAGADRGVSFFQAPLSTHGASVFSTASSPRPIPGAPTYNIRFVPHDGRLLVFGYEVDLTRPVTRSHLTVYECAADGECVRPLHSFGDAELRFAGTIGTRVYAEVVDAEGRIRFLASDDGVRWSEWSGVNDALAPWNRLPGRRFRSATIVPRTADGADLLLRVSVVTNATEKVPAEAVLRSRDAGRTWRVVAETRTDGRPAAHARPLPWSSSRASLGGVVATLAAGSDGVAYAVADHRTGSRVVSALFCSRDSGSAWQPCGRTLSRPPDLGGCRNCEPSPGAAPRAPGGGNEPAAVPATTTSAGAPGFGAATVPPVAKESAGPTDAAPAAERAGSRSSMPAAVATVVAFVVGSAVVSSRSLSRRRAPRLPE